MQKALGRLPSWLMLLIGFIAVALVGVVDVITGDYSMLIFYAVPVALEAWFVGRWGVILISLAAGVARLTSDYITYSSYSGPSIRYWNSLQDMVFLLLVGLLIVLVKKLMIDEQRKIDD